jgi:hypothetical protein
MCELIYGVECKQEDYPEVCLNCTEDFIQGREQAQEDARSDR